MSKKNHKKKGAIGRVKSCWEICNANKVKTAIRKGSLSTIEINYSISVEIDKT